MTRRLSPVLSLVTVSAIALVALGCSAPAAPAPTTAPPKPAAEPTKAAAPAQPTAAPVQAAWPEKGKPITVIVGANAGGNVDIAARVIAPIMEKDLGTPIQVVNKPGAGWQTGLTELLKAKPDGYTIGYGPLPITIGVYADPERKAVFGRKDIQTLALQVDHPNLIAVRADSPWKTTQDLVNDLKARPEKISINTTGIMGDDHLSALQFQKMTGTKFAIVHFDGQAPAMTAFLGGHVDVYSGNYADTYAQARDGKVRVLGLATKEESKLFPGVKTFEAQGIKSYSSAPFGVIMPVGAPKPVIDSLSTALKKAIESDAHRQKMDELGLPVRYMDPAGFAALWDETEAWVKPLIDEEKKNVK